jgi:sugar/nucleoside kinase (ribokinase family)
LAGENDRTILTYKGVNNFLEMKDLNKNALKSRWMYFSTMLGKSLKTVYKLAEIAEKRGIKTDLNASDSWNTVVQSLLSVVDLVIINKGKINCQWLREGEDYLELTEEKNQTLGTVVVEISELMDEATIIGFFEEQIKGKIKKEFADSIFKLIKRLSN